MSQVASLDALLEEYAQWLKENSTIRKIDDWNEVSVPFLDHVGDHFQFYVRINEGRLEFDDDGYTLHNMESSGFNMGKKRSERLAELARQFGATCTGGSITMKARPAHAGDAMNRFVQALIHVDSLVEVVERRVAGYFAEDVSQALAEQNVFYTRDVNIQGKSLYSHNFDFLFQGSKDRPTVFAQAPNRLDMTSMATILFSWNDVSETKERSNAKLFVFADDRGKTVNADIEAGFDKYDVHVMKYSEIPEQAHLYLAA